jgi:hypothetical protein
MLILQYGGLNPNMQINRHGSTAAHLAAWKDNVECLQVLKSGCYSSEFADDDYDESFSEELISRSSSSEDADTQFDDDVEHKRRDEFSSFTAIPYGGIKTWAAVWNVANGQGETPIHVAAKEGSCKAMKFFLGLAISYAEADAMRESFNDEKAIRPHCFSEDGGVKDTAKQVDHVMRPPVDFSLRNNDGMDCAALAGELFFCQEVITSCSQRSNPS